MADITKKDIADRLAEQFGIKKTLANEYLTAAFDAIADSLEEGNTVSISHFGKFSVRERAGREGTDPRTKEKIRIEASRTVGFRASGNIKDVLNKK